LIIASSMGLSSMYDLIILNMPNYFGLLINIIFKIGVIYTHVKFLILYYVSNYYIEKLLRNSHKNVFIL